VITGFCFAMDIRVSARHFSGNKDYSRGREERVSADRLGCQFACSGQVPRSDQRTILATKFVAPPTFYTKNGRFWTLITHQKTR